MLKELYKHIDDKVLTAELRESLERDFAAAVDSKASELTEKRVAEAVAKLTSEHQEHERELDIQANEMQRSLEETLAQKLAESDAALVEHKRKLNEEADKYIKEKIAAINKQVDCYAKYAADVIVEEAADTLFEQNRDLKASTMYEALRVLASTAGHDLGREINESARNTEDSLNKRIDALVNENSKLKSELKASKNNLLFEQMTSDLSLYQREKMKTSLKGIIETIDENELKTNLVSLKESFSSPSEEDVLYKNGKRHNSINSLLFRNIK